MPGGTSNNRQFGLKPSDACWKDDGKFHYSTLKHGNEPNTATHYIQITKIMYIPEVNFSWVLEWSIQCPDLKTKQSYTTEGTYFGRLVPVRLS